MQNEDRPIGAAARFAVPPAEDFSHALRCASVSEELVRLLSTHSRAGGCGLPADELAQIGASLDLGDVLETYAQLGGEIARALGIEGVVPSCLSVILEMPVGTEIKKDFALTLRPELRQAVLGRDRT